MQPRFVSFQSGERTGGNPRVYNPAPDGQEPFRGRTPAREKSAPPPRHAPCAGLQAPFKRSRWACGRKRRTAPLSLRRRRAGACRRAAREKSARPPRHADVRRSSNAFQAPFETVAMGFRERDETHPPRRLTPCASRQAAVFRGAAIRGRRAMAGNPRNPFAGNRRRADMRANGISGIRRSAPARSRYSS